METSGSADLFGRTVSVHPGGLVMSSSRSSMPWSKTPSQRSSSVAALSLDADERPAMTTAKDAYPFEFVWIDGDGLPFDAWRERPVLVGNRAAGSSVALTSVLTASISRLPRISISRCGNAEKSSPARDTASSDTTSSQAKFLVRLSSRLAVLTASPIAVIAAALP